MDNSTRQCQAKSKRSQKQCLKWACRGKRVCAIHGGLSRGPRTKKGQQKARKAAFKHGGYTKAVKQEQQTLRQLIRSNKRILRYL